MYVYELYRIILFATYKTVCKASEIHHSVIYDTTLKVMKYFSSFPSPSSASSALVPQYLVRNWPAHPGNDVSINQQLRR